MLSLNAVNPNSDDPMTGQLVLSLFPGADLLGRAFEHYGACVVSAGDILFGHDVHKFRGLRGRFDGVIGGPPCQIHSVASAMCGTRARDLIPEFLRIVREVQPRWAVMENVTQALKAETAPDWPHAVIRDYDCGGMTMRTRVFWFYGIPVPIPPPFRAGDPEYSVLSSNYRPRNELTPEGVKPYNGHSELKAHQAAILQGYNDFDDILQSVLPTPKGDWGMNGKSKNALIVYLLGNGVPQGMGNFVAGHVAHCLRNGERFIPRGAQMSIFDLVEDEYVRQQ